MIRNILQGYILQMALYIVHYLEIFRLMFILVAVGRLYRIPVMPHHLRTELGEHADQNLIGKCIVKEVFVVYVQHLFLGINQMLPAGVKDNVVDLLGMIQSF